MVAEDRRRQIIRVAVSLFALRGFRGTTTKEIANAAGVSEAIIFRHFATKEDLYSAILDCCACEGGVDPFESMAEAFKGNDDRAVFQALGLAVLNFHDESPEFQRLLLHSALEGHELAQMFWDRTVMQTYEFLGGYVRRRQAAGAFRAMDPMMVVRAFLGMLIHHSISNNLWDKARQILNISNEQAALEFTEILLKGIFSNAHINIETDFSSESEQRLSSINGDLQT
jgi:AcrR family transcriptional regulator